MLHQNWKNFPRDTIFSAKKPHVNRLYVISDDKNNKFGEHLKKSYHTTVLDDV